MFTGKHITPKHREAFSLLKHNDLVVGVLRAELGECMSGLVQQQDERVIHQLQGQAQALTTILKLIDS